MNNIKDPSNGFTVVIVVDTSFSQHSFFAQETVEINIKGTDELSCTVSVIARETTPSENTEIVFSRAEADNWFNAFYSLNEYIKSFVWKISNISVWITQEITKDMSSILIKYIHLKYYVK